MQWQLIPITDFSLHRKAWDFLNQNGSNMPLLDSRFVERLLQHFGTGHEQLAVIGEPQHPIAMAIIGKVKFGVWSTFQPAQAPLGLWLSQIDNSFDQLLPSLASCLPIHSLVLGITQQDPYLLPRPEEKGCISTIDYIQTAHINIDRSFDDYWQSRGKNLRHNLKRQRNRLDREGTKTRLEVVSHPLCMHEAVRQYGELESSGWKHEIGSAVHVDNVQGRFYIGVLTAFAETGQSYVYRYYYNDKLVASDMCVLGCHTLIILKTAYDETIETSSPTMLMRQEMFETIFNDSAIKRIEFYGKVMDWHTKWLDDVRLMYHVNYIPWKLVRISKKIFSKHKWSI